MSASPKSLRGLHAALMPDYNRAATLYWWSLALVGAAVVGAALREAAMRPLALELQIAGACVASMLAGGFPVALRGTKSSFSAAEIFIFLALLYVGLDAACLAAAAEAFVASARTSKRWTSRLVSPAVAAISMGVTGWLFLESVAALQARQLYGEGTILALLPAMAVVHFLLTSWLVRWVVHLKAAKPLRLGDLLGDFGWIASAYAAHAFVAALLYDAARHAGAVVLLAAGPMVALLLTTLHFHFRRRDAEAAAAAARIEAAQRETAQAARHNAELRRISGDGQTSLVDRRHFLERLAATFEHQGESPRGFAVIYIDIDRFKSINDRLGYAAGEEFLVHVANRIQRCLRRSDLVGNLDGDDFAVLAKDVGRDYGPELAARLLETLSRRYGVGSATFETSASIGVTFSAYGYATPDAMLRDAERAMREAKRRGGARCVVHDPDAPRPPAVPEEQAVSA